MENQTFSSQHHEDGRITIKSGTRLSVEHAAEFAACIREALTTFQQVAIEFDANVEGDITTLQILCSACRTAAAEGKAFTQAGPLPDSLHPLFQAVGAERHGACQHNHDNPCLWFGGTE